MYVKNMYMLHEEHVKHNYVKNKIMSMSIINLKEELVSLGQLIF